MTQEKTLVRSAFARAATHYDSVADFQREAGERLLAACHAFSINASAPLQVLDAGCGTGHGLQLIAKQWPQAQTIALDFAEPMLRCHSTTVSTRSIPAALAICGDIEMLPLANSSIDLVWSNLAMQWCDSARVVHEFHRVLRQTGHLAVSTLGPGTFAELRRAFIGVDEFRHTNEFIDEARLRSIFSAAKLDLVALQRIEMKRHYPDLPSLLASVRELGASHVVPINRRPGLMGKTAWRRFADNYETMRTTQGLPLTYDTYFILARKTHAP